MSELWMPGATRRDVGDHAPTDGGEPKAIAHITWDRNATASSPADLVPYEVLVNVFAVNEPGKAPHILWDPFTGRMTQFFPADSRSKSVADLAGGTRTNRAGSVVIQVEALFFPYCRVNGQVYAKLTDTPMAGWDKLHAWISSWGVPDTWPMGRPVDFTPHRDEHTWETRGGWYAHAHVPENDHQDPGSWPAFDTAGSGDQSTSTPVPAEPSIARYKTTINGLEYGYGAHGPQVKQVGEALVAWGFGKHYRSGPDEDWRDPDTLNYADYQASMGLTGADADGVPGEASLRRLLGYLPGTAPAFPGSDFFKPGQSNQYILLLGQRLVQLGFGGHYRRGPSRSWGEADRQNLADFQRSRRELAGNPDGYPGPKTWAALFS
jgi:peptidoglycan hydrolase-like protein with peptidoglycan-binding domain